MENIKAYNVVLYPTPAYFRHFLVFAFTPIEAIHKLNYLARLSLPIVKKQYPNDAYSKVTRVKDIIKATRRYKRKHKPTRSRSAGKFVIVNELPQSMVFEGALNFGPHTNSLVQNLLPDLIQLPIGNE